MKRKTMLETFLSPQELSVMQRNWDSSQVEDNELLSDLIREQMVLMVDWAEESGKYEIGTFLQRRLDRLSNGDGLPMLNQDDVYLELEKQKGFDRGNALVKVVLEYI
ncbi:MULTISPECIES: hypothetical protein [Paenibacillus]|uniref:hypothetical protein n=1 Tax=Paenibacillus TaxID=44249 RepID=UPI002FE2839F